MNKLPARLPPQFVQAVQKSMAVAQQKRDKYQEEAKKIKRQSLDASISGMQNSGWVTVYTKQVPYELDVLRSNLYPKSDMGWFIQTVLGVGVDNPLWAVGFPCNPISPPSLSVTVGPGVVYNFVFLLPIPYSVIPADTNPDHQIYKSFISFDTQTFATPAPTTPGDSIIYLIEVAPLTENVNVVSRPYFNDADPSSPIFESQSDTMLDYALLQIKAGVAAPSPTPPTPDVGFTGLYYVTVAYGQTSIVTGNITKVSGAPFVTESLTQKLSSADISATYLTKAQAQQSTVIYAPDIGTLNTIVVNPSPSYSTPTDGTIVRVKIANTNTGAVTINVNSLGAVAVNNLTITGLGALEGGELQQHGIYDFIYNSTVPCYQMSSIANLTNASSQITFQPTTTQTIPNVVTTKIEFNSVVSDTAGLINSNGFRPPAGRWRFNFSGYASTPTMLTQTVYFYKNGVQLFVLFHNNSNSEIATMNGEYTDRASGTDQYDVYFLGSSATSANSVIGDPSATNSNQYVNFECSFVEP